MCLTLFETSKSYRLPGMSEGEVPVFQTREQFCYFYIRYDHSRKEVRQMMLDGNPCNFEDIRHARGAVMDKVSLGSKIEDYKIIRMSLNDFNRLIEPDLAAAVAELHVSKETHFKLIHELRTDIKRLRADLKNQQQDYERLSKSVSTNKRILGINRQYISSLWYQHRGLLGVLQGIFSRKKWKSRIEKYSDNFFETEEYNSFFSEENDIPF